MWSKYTQPSWTKNKVNLPQLKGAFPYGLQNMFSYCGNCFFFLSWLVMQKIGVIYLEKKSEERMNGWKKDYYFFEVKVNQNLF